MKNLISIFTLFIMLSVGAMPGYSQFGIQINGKTWKPKTKEEKETEKKKKEEEEKKKAES